VPPLQALNGHLAGWDERALLPASANPHARAPLLRVHAAEYVSLEPLRQQQTCTEIDEEGVPRCALNWHVDGDFDDEGSRPYKFWLMVERGQGVVGGDTATNIIVAPLDSVPKVCASMQGPSEDAEAAAAARVARATAGVGPMPHDLYQEMNAGREGQGVLNAVLDAVGCVVHSAPGDGVFFFPDVYHRTQDMAAPRVSTVVEIL
jgi:hypothetical protein